MRVKGATVQKAMLGAALVAALLWNLTHAAEIRAVELGNGATGTRAAITLDRAGAFKVIRLKAPDRLAVDLPASTFARGLKLPAAAGVVQAVRTGQPEPGTVRIVFDVAQPVAALAPRLEQGAEGATLVIEWPGDGTPVIPVATTGAGPRTTSAAAKPEPASADLGRASADATSRLIAGLAVGASTPPSTEAAVPKPAGPSPVTGSGVAAPGASGNPAAGLPATATATAVPAPADVPVAGAAAAPTRIASGTTVSGTDPAAVLSAPAKQASSVPTPATATSRALRPLVIAIDAGHGGQDPGAIGQSGNREKDVTLAIARELARQINATPGLKAYLTRDTDMFLPLPRRAQLARQAKADMFVSIHADAAENRAARGSSVYVLSLKGASSQRARWLADKENAADLIGGVRLAQTSSTLASVLLDLTQSGHMRASEDAASQVLAGLKRIGHNHKPNVERANFAVLRTSDMPSMLVETAFISNPDEERRLTDPTHQRALARAVLDGVNAYFTRQPPPGTLYAARAEVQVFAGAGGGSP